MQHYIQEIMKIATQNILMQSDGYAQIMRLCEAIDAEGYAQIINVSNITLPNENHASDEMAANAEIEHDNGL